MAEQVWICELIKEWTTWEWLCKPCALARRTVRNEFGHLVWSKILPRRKIDGLCADCDARAQEEQRAKRPW